jgi:hypothetical protein
VTHPLHRLLTEPTAPGLSILNDPELPDFPDIVETVRRASLPKVSRRWSHWCLFGPFDGGLWAVGKTVRDLCDWAAAAPPPRWNVWTIPREKNGLHANRDA